MNDFFSYPENKKAGKGYLCKICILFGTHYGGNRSSHRNYVLNLQFAPGDHKDNLHNFDNLTATTSKIRSMSNLRSYPEHSTDDWCKNLRIRKIVRCLVNNSVCCLLGQC